MRETHVIKVYNEGLSLNAMFNAKWQVRHRLTKQLKRILTEEIKRAGIDATINEFSLEVLYNGRYDVDNTAATVKAFVDCLRDLKLVPNDTKQHFKGFKVAVDETLKNPSYEFKLYIHK